MADTQGDLITIDASAFKKFRSELDSINEGLDKMGEGLGNIERLTKGLNLKVRGLPEFKDFIQTLSSFRGIRNADKFKNLVTVAKDAAEASKFLMGIDPGITKKVETFVKAIEELRGATSFASVAGSLNFSKFGDNLKSLFTAFGDAIKALDKKANFKNLEPLKKAAQGIKEIINVVTELNQAKAVTINQPALITMRNLVDQMNSIAAKTNGAKTEQFAAMVASIKALGDLLGTGGGNIFAQFARQTGNFLKFTVAIPLIILVIKGVFSIMNIITLIPGTVSGVLLQKFDKTMISFANSMQILGKALGQGKGQGFLGGVGDFIRSVGTITKLGVVLPILFTTVTTLFKLTGTLGSIIPGNDQMFALADAFRRIASAFFNFSEALKEGGVDRLKKVSGLFATMATAFKGISTVLSLTPGTSELERLSVAFRNLGLALVSFNDALGGSKNARTLVGGGIGGVIGRLVKLGVALPLLFGVMVALFKSFSALLRALPGQDSFERFALGFKALGSGIRAISEIGSSFANVGVALKGMRIVGQLTEGIRKIASNLVSKGVFEQVVQFMQTFGEFGAGLKKAVDAGKSINLADLILLPIKLKIVGQAIGAMARAVIGTDPAGVQAFALAIRNLGQGLKNIREALSQNTATDKKALLGIFDIVKLLITLRLILNTVASVAKAATPEGIKAAAALMRDAGTLFKNLFEIFSATIVKKVDVKNVLSIRDKMKLIKDIFKQLKGFAGKELPNLGDTFRELPLFLKNISELQVRDEKGSKTLKEKINIITDALKQLSKIRLDGKGVQSLIKISGALESFSNLKNPGKVESLVTSVVNAMTQIKGFTVNAKDISQLSKFVDQLVKALQKFAQVKTTREQADALQALVKSIQLFRENGGDIGDGIKTGFKNANPKQLGVVTGEDIAEGVAEGMLRFNLRVKIVSIFKNIALAIIDLFNPISLLGRLRTGFDFLTQKFSSLFGLIAKFRDAVKSLGDDISGIGDSIVSFGQNLIGGFGIGTITNSPAFAAAADFDELSTKVQVFGNLSNEATDELRKLSLQLGKDFPLSAGDALSAASDLVKSGLGVDQIKQALPVITELTSLTDSKDINVASKGLIQVASSFKEFTANTPAGFDTLQTAADLLSQAADSSTASVESLLQGLGNVGPVASNFGLDLQQTVAVLGLFENSGIRGAEAGTQLKSLLTSFTTDRARTEFRRLGVSLTDQNGNFRDFNDILNDLNNSMNGTKTVTRLVGTATAQQSEDVKKAEKAYAAASRQLFIYQNGLSTGAVNDDEETRAKKIAALQQVQQNAQNLIAQVTGSQAEAERVTVEITRSQQQNATSIQQLAGSFGGVGLSALLAQGDDALKNFIDTMGTLPGAGERARQLLDNFKGDALQLQGSLETLAVIGFEPLVKNIFRPMVQFLRIIIDSFIELNPAIIEVVTTGVALAAIFATITGSGLVVVGTLTKIGGAVIALSSNLLNQRALFLGLVKGLAGFAVGLISLAAAAIPLIVIFGGLAFALQKIRQIFSSDLGGANTAFQKMIDTGRALFRTFGSLADAAFSFVRVLFGGGGGAGSPLESAGAAMASLFGNITDKIQAFSRTLQKVSSGFKILIRGLAKGALNDRQAQTLSENPLFKMIFGIRGEESTAGGVQQIFGALKTRSATLKNILNATSATVSEFFSNLGKGASLKDAFFLFSGQLKFNLARLGSEFLKLFGDVFKIDTSFITDLLDKGDITGGIQALLGNIGDKIKNALLGNRQGIGDVLETLFRTFFVPGRIFGRIAGLLGLSKVSKIFDEIANVLGKLFRGVIDTIFNLLSGQDLGTALRTAFAPLGPSIVGSIVEVINNAIGILGDLLGIDTTVFSEQISAGFQPVIDDFTSGKFDDLLLDVGSAVINVLSVAIQTALTGLGKILGIDTSVAAKQIEIGFRPLIAAIQSGNIGEIAAGFGIAVATVLATALQLAVNTLGNFLHFDTQTVFDQISIGFKPLADAITAGDASALTIVSGIVSAVTGLLASALVTGIEAIGSILKVDTTAILKSISESTQVTAAAASEGDILTTGTGLVTTILNGLAGLISIGISKIGDFLHIDVSAALDSLQTTMNNNISALQTGGPGAPFAVVGNTIIGLLAAAISTAFSGLGDLLNIDTATVQQTLSDKFAGVIQTINDIFLGEDGTSIFDNITNIINDIVTAFTNLFNLFANQQKTADEQGSALEKIVNFLGSLVGLGLDVIQIPLRALDSLIQSLADLDSTSTVAVLTALGVVLAANAVKSTAAFTALQGMLTQLAAGNFATGLESVKGLFNTLKNSTIAKGAAIFVIFNFITGLIDNLTSLSKLDVAGIIGGVIKSFTDLGFDILDVLGIDTGDLKQRINTAIFQVVFLIRQVGILMGAALQDNVFTPVKNFFDEAFVNLRIMGEEVRLNLDKDAQERFRGSIAAAEKFVSDAKNATLVDGRLVNAEGTNTNFAEFLNNVVLAGVGQFGDSIEGPILKEKVRTLAQSAMPQLLSGFQQEFDAQLDNGKVTDQSRAVAAKWVNTILFLDGFDDVARQAAASGDINLLGVLIEEAAKQGVPQDKIDTALQGIYTAFQTGIATGQGQQALDTSISVLDSLIANAKENGLDPTKLEAFKKKIVDEYNLLVADAQLAVDDAKKANETGDGTGGGVDAEVPVDPNVVVTKTPEEVKTDAQKAVTDAMNAAVVTGAGGGATVPVPTTVGLDVTDATVTNPDDVKTKTDAALTDETGVLNVTPPTVLNIDNISTPQQALDLQLALQNLQLEFTNTDTTFATTVANMTTAWTPFSTLVKGDLTAMTLQMAQLLLTIARMPIVLAIASIPTLTILLNLQTGFTNMANAAITGLARIMGKAADLNFILQQIIGNINSIKDTGIPTGGGNGIQPDGGGQSGITVHPNRIYEVTETGDPELLSMNGRTFLLPGSGGTGQVIPAINASSLTGSRTTVGTPSVNSNGQNGVGQSIIINEGDISITLPAGIQNTAEVAAAVRDAVIQARNDSRKSVPDRLRDKGR